MNKWTLNFRLGPINFYGTGVHLLPYAAAEDERKKADVKENETLG